MRLHFFSHKELIRAILLAAAGLIINVVGLWFSPDQFVPLGNIFLFFSPAVFGIPGALVSVAIGVIPQTLWTGDHLFTLQMICLTACLAYGHVRLPFVPMPFLIFLAWTCLLGPFLMLLSAYQVVPEAWTVGTIFVRLFWDLLSCVSAGCLALWPRLVVAVTSNPPRRHTSLQLFYTFALMICTGYWASSSILLKSAWLRDMPEHVALWDSLILIVIFIGTWSFSKSFGLVVDDDETAFQLLASNRSKWFSGLSTDFWRRENSRKTYYERLDSRAVVRFPDGERASDASDQDQGLCAVDRTGTLLFLNPNFRELAQIRHSDVLGKSLAVLSMNTDIQREILDLIEGTIARGPRTVEARLHNPPSDFRYLELQSSFPDPESGSAFGNASSIIIKMRDVTKRRSLDSAILKGQRLGALGAFVTGIGHAFNNALTTIAVQASFASHDSDPEKIKQAFNRILESTSEAGSLVRQLLRFAEAKPWNMVNENLAESISDRLHLLKSVVGEAYELILEVGIGSTQTVCDINLVIQALTSLLLNAKESYKSASGKIWIALSTETISEEIAHMQPGARPGNFVRLRVSDTGSGMTLDALRHAFDPITSPEGAYSPHELGLSIAYAIVRAHDGFLTAESHPEKGTIVSMYIPLIQSETKKGFSTVEIESSASEPPSLKSLSGNNEGILVVEDDRNIRDVVSSMLKSLNYRVESCGNGEEALARCERATFDLVLVDLVMPRMHGLEFVKKVRESHPQVKTVLMTGYGSIPEQASEHIQVLPKPFDIEALARAIRDSLLEAKSDSSTVPPQTIIEREG